MAGFRDTALSKVPEVTLGFWIIKIAATTLGETGGDTVTMTLKLGLSDRNGDLSVPARGAGDPRRSPPRSSTRSSTGRPSSPRRPPARRWPISPTARSASAIPAERRVASALLLVLGLWYWSAGTISVETVNTPKSRRSTGRRSRFRRRWAPRSATGWPIRPGLAMRAARWCSLAGLAILAAAYYWTDVSRVLLFWAAFILTRPWAQRSAIFSTSRSAMAGWRSAGRSHRRSSPVSSSLCLVMLPQRPGRHPSAVYAESDGE